MSALDNHVFLHAHEVRNHDRTPAQEPRTEGEGSELALRGIERFRSREPAETMEAQAFSLAPSPEEASSPR